MNFTIADVDANIAALEVMAAFYQRMDARRSAVAILVLIVELHIMRKAMT